MNIKYNSIIIRLICNISIEVNTGCWIWIRRKNNRGYPVISIWEAGRSVKKFAHRIAYEAFVGPIPVGLQLDHECENNACICPAHTKPVTNEENIRLRDERRLKYLASRI
jgi:hypothetical protein